MKKLAGLAGAIVLAAALGACSSSSSTSVSSSTSAKATTSPMSGTETLTGTIAGATAAKILNGGTTVNFTAGVFTGPVDTTIKGVVNAAAAYGTLTFVTPAGNFTVQFTAKTNGGEWTVTGKSGNTCYFKLDASAGTYTVLGSKSTGKFAGATGSGTYVITFRVAANLPPGKTTCKNNATGPALAKGTSITFKASGPLTLKK